MSVPERMSDEALARLYHGDAEARAELARQAAADDVLAARVADWTRQDEALRALYAPVEDVTSACSFFRAASCVELARLR